jgi:hypothetical protein
VIPPAHVKPYVVRRKNDAADAAAIREAVTRPSVRTTAVETAEQQAARVVHRTHEPLSRQRVTLINAIRSRMAEFGVLAPTGPQHVGRLIERIADPATALPDAARGAQRAGRPARGARPPDRPHGGRDGSGVAATMPMALGCRPSPASARSRPGAIPAGVPDIAGFRSGRDFAAWLGLVPRQSSSGGRERLGRITEMGDRTIRRPARDRRPVGHPVGPPEAGLRRALDRQARGQEAPEARRRGARRRDGADRLGGADAGRGLQGGGSGRASAAARRRAVVVHRR